MCIRDSRYDHTAGNQWWVEVHVDNQEIEPDFVWARVEGRPWEHQLEKQWWGNWAKSFHVPAGSLVEFRLRSVHGETLFGDPCYFWPSRAMHPDPGGKGCGWPYEKE